MKTRKPVKSYQRKTKTTSKKKKAVKSYAPKGAPMRGAPLPLTPAEYSGLQAAYDFFNTELFASELPDCFIVYTRKPHSAGHFAPNRYSLRVGDDVRHHELSLNPDAITGHTDKDVCDTLVHEMTHAWQQHCGKPSARGYHNKEWAAKMKSIGLQPSNTGMVGGKETGSHMSDYPIPNGPFEKAFTKLAATGWKLNLQSALRPGPKTATPSSKTKFTCPVCAINAWGKPDLQITCTVDRVPMLAETIDNPVLDRTNDDETQAAE
jgi:SprT-like family